MNSGMTTAPRRRPDFPAALLMLWAALVLVLSVTVSAPRLRALGGKLADGWTAPSVHQLVRNAGRHLGTFALAGGIGVAAAAAGVWCWAWLGGGVRRLRPYVLIPLGAIPVSLLLLGLLLVRVWFLPVMTAAIALPLLPLMWRTGRPSPASRLFRLPPPGDPGRIWLWVALAGALTWLPWTLAPESQPDAYEYFLAGPERWLWAHGLSVTGAPATQQYPALAEVLFAFPVAAGLEGAAKVMNAGLLMCGVLGFLAVVAETSSARWAGIAFAVTSVSGGWFFSTGKNEGFGAGYLLLALAVGLAGRGSRRGLVVSAVLAGGALSTKLLAGVNLAWVPLVVIPVWWGTGFPALVRWSAVAGLVALPWWAKAWALTADPWYPVLSGSVPSLFPGRDPRCAEVFRMTTGGTAYRPRWPALAFHSVLVEHAAALFLLPVALTTASRWRLAGICSVAMYALAHAFLPVTQIGRWMFPALAPALLLAGSAAPAWMAGIRWRAAAIAAVFAAGWLMAVAVRDGDPNPLPYLAGSESAASFQRRILTVFMPVRDRLAHDRDGSALLLAGEVRGYGLPQPVRVANGQAAGDPQLAWTLAARSASAQRMAVGFRQLGITRMLVNPIVLMRAAGAFAPFGWTPRQLAVYADFAGRWWELVLAPASRDHLNGCHYLYAIRRVPVAAAPPYLLHLPGVESELSAIVAGGAGGSPEAEIGRLHADLARLPRVLQFEHVAASASLATGDAAAAFRFTRESVAHGWLDDDNLGVHAVAAVRLRDFDAALRALGLIRTGYAGWEGWADKFTAEVRFHRAVRDLGRRNPAGAERDLAAAIAGLPAAGGDWLPSRAGLLHAARSLALSRLHRPADAAAELRVAAGFLPDLAPLTDPGDLERFLIRTSADLLPAAP